MKPSARIAIGPALPALLILVATEAFAIDSGQSRRFELTGSGTLVLDAPVLSRGELKLKAMLSAGVSAPAAPSIQSNGRFALSGTLGAASLVCYSDTIFRDDFDADGF